MKCPPWIPLYRGVYISNEGACFIRKLGGDWKLVQILTLGGILCSDFITTSLCGMSTLHLFKSFLLVAVWTITPKFCNCQTIWMLPVHDSKHVEMFTLLYVYNDTRFLSLQTVHLEYHQQRSSGFFILKMHQNRHFWKSWFLEKSLELMPPSVRF